MFWNLWYPAMPGGNQLFLVKVHFFKANVKRLRKIKHLIFFIVLYWPFVPCFIWHLCWNILLEEVCDLKDLGNDPGNDQIYVLKTKTIKTLRCMYTSSKVLLAASMYV